MERLEMIFYENWETELKESNHKILDLWLESEKKKQTKKKTNRFAAEMKQQLRYQTQHKAQIYKCNQLSKDEENFKLMMLITSQFLFKIFLLNTLRGTSVRNDPENWHLTCLNIIVLMSVYHSSIES